MAKIYPLRRREVNPVAPSIQSNYSRVCIAQLATLYRNQGQGSKAIEAIDSIRGLLAIIARKEHLTEEGRVQAACLCYRLSALYEKQSLSMQAGELNRFAESISGIKGSALENIVQPQIYVSFIDKHSP